MQQNILKKLVVTFALVAFGQGVAAQPAFETSEPDNKTSQLEILVDINVTNLVERVTAITIACGVSSLYESAGVVGEGKALIYDGATYSFEDVIESGIGLLDRLTLVRTENVFGDGGSREFIQTIKILVSGDEGETFLESWNSGSCYLSVIAGPYALTGDFDDLEGLNPTDCSDGEGSFSVCVRPGTSAQDAFFSFERDFGESGGFFGGNDGASDASEGSGN